VNKKIIIFLLISHWIGDNFWSLQVIPYLKKEYFAADIYVGIKGHSRGLLHGVIDDKYIIEINNVISDRHRGKYSFKEYTREIKKVREHKFDIGIDLSGNRYTAIFLFFPGVKNRVGLDLHKLSFLYNVRGWKFDYCKHLVNRPFEVAKLLFPIFVPDYPQPVRSNVLKCELQKQVIFSLDDKLA
jgi:ADP-heptose:LPS heptosyltransferase